MIQTNNITDPKAVQTKIETEHTKPELTQSLLWLITITTGIVVGNNYYNQPLLGLMAKDFQVTEAAISIIAMLTQVGFAVGLLFIVPLGDMVQRKKLILSIFLLIIVSLMGMVLAPTLPWLYIASFMVGFSSVVPQMLVPLTAELSTPEKRSSSIGMVMSGLLLGILLSRVAAGFIGDIWGWKAIYYIAIGCMVALMALLAIKLPDVKPTFKGHYGQLMHSLIHLTKTQPVLRLSAFRGALGFAGFSAFWITLVFHLEEAPFHAGSAVAGSFGLIGAVGALAASAVGKVAKRVSTYTIILVAIFMLLASWIIFYFGGYTYFGLILGVILIDLGLQSMHISNQSTFFALNIGATNRLNTVYMFSYFAGGSLGSYLASQAWKYFKWDGVVFTGLFCTLLVLAAHLLYGKKTSVN
ncbi:MFS transporter [Chryseobacterium sp. c4a]|uniref:MFS transporter n=1 Tax=Chryseobacterium sp. c4a TaxID=1573582 RepID=UPI001358948A|nr:MFS transporter [Chryseobacterium sp. c4a]